MTVGMIWAQSTAGVIGRDGGLPWRLPEDMAHFRQVTNGRPVIMGRRTWESLPARFRPLPGRRTIVLTRQPDYQAPGAELAGSLPDAIRLADGDGDGGMVWLAGGADVYAAGASGLATVAEVTEVDIDISGDTFAPPLSGWRLAEAGDWLTSVTGLRYRFRRFLRSPA